MAEGMGFLRDVNVIDRTLVTDGKLGGEGEAGIKHASRGTTFGVLIKTGCEERMSGWERCDFNVGQVAGMALGYPRESVQGTFMNVGLPWEVRSRQGLTLLAALMLWELMSALGESGHRGRLRVQPGAPSLRESLRGRRRQRTSNLYIKMLFVCLHPCFATHEAYGGEILSQASCIVRQSSSETDTLPFPVILIFKKASSETFLEKFND